VSIRAFYYGQAAGFAAQAGYADGVFVFRRVEVAPVFVDPVTAGEGHAEPVFAGGDVGERIFSVGADLRTETRLAALQEDRRDAEAG